ncbi:uncharacterized protein RHOBADRAFT_66693 [Rhodotorula graminis WP1]|uniref:Autophagy-related protein 3 n=1 Tax=Rhodotorula graminis (strain WP1) TaxID=578459 RepID=A0A0P9EX42_RHOGW|nr:uncharacterized protein RHOBADRAFT_66693 [Rhodotorula graminis WP1]KPV73984.1 hypothetical protein RHOBADRAFT_66693 [Rhodotorula graminis WP1]
MLGSIQTHFWAVRDYLAPVLRDSKFKETGRLTPDEFVAAGDFLVYKFPTWQWEGGDPTKARDFLPKDKQYLVSRNVPCLRRVSQLGQQGGAGDEYAEMLMDFAEGGGAAGDEGDEWVATHTNAQDPNSTTDIPSMGDIPDADDLSSSSGVDGVTSSLADTSLNPNAAAAARDEVPDFDDIPDMDDEAGGAGLVEDDDDAAVQVEPSSLSGGGTRSDKLVQVRTYDCMISYDKYYQTPRMWLLGYDEHKRPLPPTSALDDVSSDHALKTVTIEPFPHSGAGLSIASVHPCKHSAVMKKVIERMDGNVREMQRRARAEGQGQGEGPPHKEKEKEEKKGGGSRWLGLGKKKDKEAAGAKDGSGEGIAGADADDEGLRVEQYLLVFLKFISTITPTIEVDSTASI